MSKDRFIQHEKNESIANALTRSGRGKPNLSALEKKIPAEKAARAFRNLTEAFPINCGPGMICKPADKFQQFLGHIDTIFSAEHDPHLTQTENGLTARAEMQKTLRQLKEGQDNLAKVNQYVEQADKAGKRSPYFLISNGLPTVQVADMVHEYNQRFGEIQAKLQPELRQVIGLER